MDTLNSEVALVVVVVVVQVLAVFLNKKITT
jgi:hypothetical protein